VVALVCDILTAQGMIRLSSSLLLLVGVAADIKKRQELLHEKPAGDGAAPVVTNTFALTPLVCLLLVVMFVLAAILSARAITNPTLFPAPRGVGGLAKSSLYAV
jgi:hypothetical protein